MIVGVLLAAGRGRRFGADKLAAKLQGRAVIRWSAEALARHVERLYVVVPLGTNTAMRALSKLDPCFVENWARDEGMASSIRAGVEAMPDDVEAIVLALADQPLVSPDTVRALIDRWHRGDVAAVAPAYRNGRGHPVLFGRECFAALAALHGDVGARGVLEALGNRLALIEVDADVPLDVDTPDDLHEIVGTLSNE
ncbi:MAG: nucleotidyltransferase family protein [bacterium]